MPATQILRRIGLVTAALLLATTTGTMPVFAIDTGTPAASADTSGKKKAEAKKDAAKEQKPAPKNSATTSPPQGTSGYRPDPVSNY
jgi:hypothetical protein